MTPHRIMFRQIESIWLFYLMAAVAAGLFFAGMISYVQVWKKSKGSLKTPFSKKAFKTAFLDTFLGKRILHGELAAGLMHMLIFWGFVVLFIGTASLSVHEYLFPFLNGTTYLVFSLAMEIAGLMLLAGILWALVRRYIQRIPRLERRPEDVIVPSWLLLAGLSGFIVEGLRLAHENPQWRAWSFAGEWLIPLFSSTAAMDLYPYFWWGHAILSLSFIAVIPFTKLFHIIGAPAAIYMQEIAEPVVLNIETLEKGAANFGLNELIFFDACMRCGRCVAACPSAGAGEPLAPRDFVQAVRRNLWQAHFPIGDIRFLNRGEETAIDEKFWYCTTCRACLEVCPIYGAAYEAVMKHRISVVEEGTNVPKLLNQTLEKVFKYDNPWESTKTNRGAWAEGLEIKDLTKRGETGDFCYFVGCTTSFDDTAKGIAVSFSRILQTAGIEFGILGKKEPCCGDIARRAGELGLFLEQTDKCLDIFDKYEITDLVTSSPHCFHTFRNEYPDAPFKTRHYTMVLHQLLRNGKLRFHNGRVAKVTYHDPCYLGRYNHIFEEPREIIQSIPGLTLVEMAHYGTDSLCCGGGGDRMWQDLQSGGGKMSDIRIREAVAASAEIVVTACPLCRIMLEDARKAAGLNEAIQVMDLNELVLSALSR